MESETAWEKVLCRLFFAQARKMGTANKRMDDPLKKMFIRTELCYSVDEANS
jgi:hypothetical protein